MGQKLTFYATLGFLSILFGYVLIANGYGVILTQSASSPGMPWVIWSAIVLLLIYFVWKGSNKARIALLILWGFGGALFAFGFATARMDGLSSGGSRGLFDVILVLILWLLPTYTLGLSSGFRREMNSRLSQMAKDSADRRAEFYRTMGEDPENPWRPGYGPNSSNEDKTPKS